MEHNRRKHVLCLSYPLLRLKYNVSRSVLIRMNYTLKIAVIGGRGKVGRFIADYALKRGYQVRMLVRSINLQTTSNEHIEVVEGDARDKDVIANLIQGCNVVINTLGQPAKDSPIYSAVTSNILTAMNDLGIRRYIAVTGGSLNVDGDHKSLLNKLGARLFLILYPAMMADKKKEHEILASSNIDWTLVRLPVVVEGPQTGRIKVNLTDMPGMKMTNQDIADFLLQQIDDTKYIGKTPFIAN